MEDECKEPGHILTDGVETLPEEGPPIIEFDYELFLRRMRHPSCRPLVTRVKNFISSFKERLSTGATPNFLVHRFRDFLDEIELAVRENPVWRLVGDANPQQYKVAREGMEYLLMNQLYTVTFSPVEDRDRDEHLLRKVILFSDWIKPSHLDISEKILKDESFLEEAISEFCQVNKYLTPRDKLICLLNGCRVVQNIVKVGCPEASADEIMPVLIFVILKAKIVQLYSNLQYISRYRDPRALFSDKAYHFTSLLAATTFIERMDQKCLVISEDDYNVNMETAVMKLNEGVVNVEEDQKLAFKLAVDDSSSPVSIYQKTSTPPDVKFKEEATKVFENVKEKLWIGASKSIDYLGKLMDEAEASIKAVVNSGTTSPVHSVKQGDDDDEETTTRQALIDEDEYQLQLAMAISLSEKEFIENKGKLITELTGQDDQPLIDVQELDGKSSSTEPS